VHSPREPMLREFQIINEAPTKTKEDLNALADRICELFTDDCVLEDTSTTHVVHGLSELHGYCQELFGPFSDVRIEPKEIIDAHDVSVMVITISGTHTGDLYGHPATGKRVSWPAVAVYRCNPECTKVRHETLAYDTGFMLSQIVC
jgi:predicted ester cyclase